MRGAAILVECLKRCGVSRIFALSGNHVMPIFDALLDSGVELIHVRHEAAAVHMADAWSRLTGEVGIALVTGGQGHTNACAALYTAAGSEAPMVLLSGHPPLSEWGRGAFQDLRQAEFAAPLTKLSLTAKSTATIGRSFVEAVRAARSGTPGPTHLSLPVDVLENSSSLPIELPEPLDFVAHDEPMNCESLEELQTLIAEAKRPLILCGPSFCRKAGRMQMLEIERHIGIPVLGLESPRGIHDPSLGAFAEVLSQADLLVLVMKPLDFSLKFGWPPFVDPACRFAVLNSNWEDAMAADGTGERVVFGANADMHNAVSRLLSLPQRSEHLSSPWLEIVRAAVSYRPPEWLSDEHGGANVHPIDLCRSLNEFVYTHSDTILVCDGGEIGQWPQALVEAQERLINGVSGTIGVSIPFAIAAKASAPQSPVIAVVGDGAFGFHMAEFDTALRHKLPIIVVVGNDACWNAEHQIQIRDYGAARAWGCDLLPTRYDLVVEAIGGFGVLVTRAEELANSLEKAFASGKPACVNVMIRSVPAPRIQRSKLPVSLS